MKQETLEKAAEHGGLFNTNSRSAFEEGFIQGAKWQQEQMEKLKDFEVWKEWKNTNEIKSE